MNLTTPASDLSFSLSIRTPKPLKCKIPPKKWRKVISAKVTISAPNEAPAMSGTWKG